MFKLCETLVETEMRVDGGNNNIMIKNTFKIFFGSFTYKREPFQNVYHSHQN